MENKDKVPPKRRMPEIPPAKMPSFWKSLLFWIVLGVFIFYLAHSSSSKVTKEKAQKIPYSDFLNCVANNEIDRKSVV